MAMLEAESVKKTHLLNSFSLSSAKDNEKVHLLPCKINYDGPANVEQYFIPGVHQQDCSEGMKAAFRGRPLDGKKLSLPADYIGVVLKEDTHLSHVSDDNDSQLNVTCTFRDFTYWNLDRTPNADDKINSINQWIDIANAIHIPQAEKCSQETLPSQ